MSDMKKRFTYYGLGFAMGLLIVFFFLGGKQPSCNWLPNDQLLNIIRQTKKLYSEEVTRELGRSSADSLDIRNILESGDVDFSRSRVKNEPCRLYWIQGEGRQEPYVITVEVCDSLDTVLTFKALDLK